jgi:hypothetical protein
VIRLQNSWIEGVYSLLFPPCSFAASALRSFLKTVQKPKGRQVSNVLDAAYKAMRSEVLTLSGGTVRKNGTPDTR